MTTTAEQARQRYAELMDFGSAQEAAVVECARHDPLTFGEYAFNFQAQPLHERWHTTWDSTNRSVTWAPPEHGKTFHLVFVRFIHELGRNQNKQLMHVSATAVVPEGTLRRAAEHIAWNERVRRVFPELRIEKFGREQAQNLALWLKRPPGHTDRDPNWVTLGIRNQIHGRRCDGLAGDDFLDFENTYTKAARDKTTARISNTLMGRLSADAFAHFIGYPFFKNDTMCWLAEREGYTFNRYDVMCDPDGNEGPPGLWPDEVRDPITKKPYGWPWERILAKESEVNDLDWVRQWRCRIPADSMALFTWDLMRQAMDKGRGLPLRRPAPPGIVPVTGVDPATGDGSDETVITTGYSAGGMRHTLDVRGGLWDDARLYVELGDILRTYPNHGGILVEDNGFASLLVNTINRADVMAAYGWTPEIINRARVRGYTTGKQKHTASVGLRSLQIDFKNGRTVLPSQPDGKPWPEIRKLTQGFVDYDPGAPTKHTSDWVMSYWLCVEMQRRLGQDIDRRPRI